jgi:cellulose synthase (UDP-forming)
VGTYYLMGLTTLLFLLFPYAYLWMGVQPASMRFGEFILYASPVGAIGTAMYLYGQRWLAGGPSERGLHLRGLMLKIACCPVYVSGTLLALARAGIPYIPTSKRAVRRAFLRLAWPHLLLIAAYLTTVTRVVFERIFVVSESRLELTSEATWGMVAFATIPVLTCIGVLRAAFESSRAQQPDDAWDSVAPVRTAEAAR